MNATLTTSTVKATVTVTHTAQKRIRCQARVEMPEYGIAAGQFFQLVRVSGTTYLVKKIEISKQVVTSSGSVICTVRNGEGTEYTTILNRTHDHTCSCPAGHNCYHIDIAKRTVNAQMASQKATRKPIDLSEHGNLNGNRGFSLLKAA